MKQTRTRVFRGVVGHAAAARSCLDDLRDIAGRLWLSDAFSRGGVHLDNRAFLEALEAADKALAGIDADLDTLTRRHAAAQAARSAR